MPPDDSQHESFEAFKDSFFYGSRTDLNFKFLKNISDQDAAKFFQDLLWKMGDSFDDGDLDRLVEHVYEWQIRGYSGEKGYAYPDGPFTPLRKPISESRLVLVASSGHFVEGQDPEPFGVKNMTQKEAIERIGEFLKVEPQLSSVRIDTPKGKLRVRHGGYDIRGAQADPNVLFPLERLVELCKERVIGELVPEAYSFVGATSQTRLLKHTGPQWAKMLKQQQIDAALLVPVWPVCHVSVGHVARILEKSGIATVIIAIRAFRDRLEAMTVPRVVITPHLMGRPLGAPGDSDRQRASILTALELLEKAKRVGTVIEMTGL